METNTKVKTHHFVNPFPIEKNCLMIGGLPLPQLAQIVGKTPFYAYDRAVVKSKIELLRQYLPATLHLHYAIKANPMPSLVSAMVEWVDGFDVASGQELVNAINAGMPANKISFAGPGKTPAELQQAIAAGITLNVESPTELSRIIEIKNALKLPAKVALRVNPSFELKSSGMKMGGGSKQFGVDEDQVPALLQRIASNALDFQGFHIFSGSQNLNSDAIQETHGRIFKLIYALTQNLTLPLRHINIGGGFGIPYFPGEMPLDIKPVGDNLAKLLNEAHTRLPGVVFVVEFGRYLVGEAGIYVCQVVDKKISHGQEFLITNGGLHHHLAASGNFGQVIRKNYPVLIGNKIHTPKKVNYTVVGPLCTPLDTLAEKMALSEADIGDYVVIFQSGAYGKTASPENFLSHPGCGEVLV